MTKTVETTADKLVREPYSFDFVEAVRQVYRHAAAEQIESRRVGFDNFPDQEVVRFRVATTLRHTSCQIVSIKAPTDDAVAYELTVPFIGLVGASGVLPRHYSRMVISRVKVNDYAMRDFFDLFHHRIVSAFFRASTKYRLAHVREMATMEQSQKDDPITQSLRCLVGFGGQAIKNQLPFNDDVFLFFGGHFSKRIPTAIGLTNMLGDFIGCHVEVKQFQFEWLYIDPAEQTTLENHSDSMLGMNTVIGSRVPSYQNRFRLRVGPVTWEQFGSFMPTTDKVKKVADFVRTYVGIGFDYDLQLTMDWVEIPELKLGSDTSSQLGWNSWITSENVSGIVDDAVFELT